jgi:hypothetical protein
MAATPVRHAPGGESLRAPEARTIVVDFPAYRPAILVALVTSNERVRACTPVYAGRF